MESFEYVIVDAGSTARVLANRRAARGDSKVLLREAGGPDDALAIHVPTAVHSMFGSATTP